MVLEEQRRDGWRHRPGPIAGSTVATLLFVVTLYVGFALTANSPVSLPIPGGYYGHLAEGFLKGQTYFAVQPDPRLADLENPYAGYQGIPRWHDTTYFNGHYYLYFGAAPAVLLIAPWHLLTGLYPTDAALVTLLSTLGFLFAAGVWLRIAGRHLPDLPVRWLNLGVLVLGCGTFIPYLLQSPTVYQVAISTGYALLMAALYALVRATEQPGWGRLSVWLGLASAAWGCAVGARPNYVYSLPVLGVVALWLVLRLRGNREARGVFSWLVPLACAVVPAAFAGIGLALYNQARFGSPIEFGVRYQLASVDQRSVALFSFSHVLPNLRAYFIQPCLFTPYFPFVSQQGDACGMATWTPFALLGFFLPVVWFLSRPRQRPVWIGAGLAVLAVACAQLGGLLLIAFQSERYEVDFVPALSLAAVFAMGGIALPRRRPGLFWRAVRTGVAVAGVASVCIGILFALDRNPLRSAMAPLARVMNYPADLWERLAGVQFGPVSGKLSLGPGAIGTREPLVVSSHGRDVLFAERLPENQIRFGFIHQGTMTPLSDPVTIEPGKAYPFTFDLGSLYPPVEHPRLSGYPRDAVDALNRRVRVIWDHQVVLDAACSFYPSSPDLVRLGRNPDSELTLKQISGRLTELRRGGVPSLAELGQNADTGPVRLRLKFPPFVSVRGEPLVSTGAPKKGDVIFVTYLEPGKLQFGHNSAAGGAVTSRPLEYDPDRIHTVDIDEPPLAAPGQGSRQGTVNIRFDGKLVLSAERDFTPTTPLDTAFGYNAAKLSAAGELFTGPTFKVARLKHFAAPEETARDWGALDLSVRFPEGRTGECEPLLCTGRKGKGNLVYVRYLSDHEIQVGYDHWGVGAATGEPVPVDFGAVNRFEISIGSLYPELDDPWWSQAGRPRGAKETVLVKLNGRVVLQARMAAHPSDRDEIVVGMNPIGGSTTGSAFTGEIQSVETVPIPREVP